MATNKPNGKSNPDEFLRLFMANERRLLGFVVSLLPNLNDAEEVVQETTAVLWERFADYTPGTNFAAWAFSIARFKVFEFRRKHQRQGLLLSDEVLESIAKEAEDLGQVIEDRSRALAYCVEQLEGPDKKILYCRYQRGNTLKSTAKQDGRSEVTIRKALRRIYRCLEKCINAKMSQEGL